MIVIDKLTKCYGDTMVLENTSYRFPQRGLVCLVGPSGGGKTTLLNLIAGFDSDYQGTLFADGEALHELTPEQLCNYRKNKVGFVFQNYHLLPGYSALENAALALALSSSTQEEACEVAAAQLSALGLGDKLQQSIETLSGGQKQRVAIARALLGQPRLLLCDEPTGALDRQSSGEIMALLQEIAKEKLVLVITHDDKLLPFADEVLRIEARTLVAERQTQHSNGAAQALEAEPETTAAAKLPPGKSAQPLRRAAKNFRVHLRRYLAVALAISIGLTAFLFSLSFGNVMAQSIAEFEQKNTALCNGYIKGTDDGSVLRFLQEDERLENIYYQYKLLGVSLKQGEHSETLAEKLPLPKATQSVSYGVMPRRGAGEIALSPSLAKKFHADIATLVGQRITLSYDGEAQSLSISGIYNAGYDDFMLSSDIEQALYAGREGEENYAISYDAKSFGDVVASSNRLQLHNISAQTAAKEVAAMQDTFASLQRLFLIVSALVLLVALFLCSILLLRQQSTRYREVGLLAALGFSRREIAAILRDENLLLAAGASVCNAFFLLIGSLFFRALGLAFSIGFLEILLCTSACFVLIALIGAAASAKLTRAQPAEALRK